MNCDKFVDMTGMRCNQLGTAIEVLTPFTFSDGNVIELFAQERGSQIHFFDDGFTLLHLHSIGIQLGNNRRRWMPLKKIAETYGVTLSDNGVFETLGPIQNARQGFARIMATLVGVATWEREQVGINANAAFFVDEVAFFLRAWKPSENLIENVAVSGFSGRTLNFDFEFDGKYVDAISPHSSSTGAELRKLVDFNSGPTHSRREVLVIVDDRRNAALAKQEIGIIGRVAKTWPMSSLISASGIALTTNQLPN